MGTDLSPVPRPFNAFDGLALAPSDARARDTTGSIRVSRRAPLSTPESW